MPAIQIGLSEDKGQQRDGKQGLHGDMAAELHTWAQLIGKHHLCERVRVREKVRTCVCVCVFTLDVAGQC